MKITQDYLWNATDVVNNLKTSTNAIMYEDDVLETIYNQRISCRIIKLKNSLRNIVLYC